VITKPDNLISAELHGALVRNQGTTGSTYRLMIDGFEKASEIVEQGSAANVGVVYNDKATLRAILEGEIPTSPSRARGSGRFVGGLLRANPDLSSQAKEFLILLRDELDNFASDEVAQKSEDLEIEKLSNELEKSIEDQGGVYVYTFPTYFKNPIKSDPERFWLKVGRTEQIVEMRIANQTRQTAMPEDPWILRVYQSDSISTSDLEMKIHKMLVSAGHARTEARHGGREWFATNLDFLDEIARLLELKVLRTEI
jgi:hypothetical protein